MGDNDGGRRDETIAAIVAVLNLRTLDELQAILEFAARAPSTTSTVPSAPGIALVHDASDILDPAPARKHVRRNNSDRNLRVMMAIRHHPDQCASPDAIYDWLLANRHPVSVDREIGVRQVMAALRNRRSVLREWPDGRWSRRDWNPPTPPIADTQTGS